MTGSPKVRFWLKDVRRRDAETWRDQDVAVVTARWRERGKTYAFVCHPSVVFELMDALTTEGYTEVTGYDSRARDARRVTYYPGGFSSVLADRWRL